MVRSGVEAINESARSRPLAVDEELVNKIVDKATAQYQTEVAALSGLIFTLSRHNPSRRARKLHIGLFGYSRSLKGISLPRAIPFCSALYSIGVPPELLGLSALSEKELDTVRTMYVSFDEDITDALRHASKASIARLPGGVGAPLLSTLSRFRHDADSEYCEAAEEVLDIALSDNRSRLTDAIMRTAWKRNFIG